MPSASESAITASTIAPALGLGQRGRLRQLHRQPRRVDAQLREPSRQDAGEVGAMQLARGDVEGDVRLQALLAPLEHLPGERADDPVADRLEQAHLLGGGDEVVGEDEPAVGVVPAQQRLHGGETAAGELHDRLVVEDELGLGDRPPQPRRQRQALERVVGDLRVDVEAARPRRLLWYIAMSACWSSSAGALASSGYSEIPTLDCTWNSAPETGRSRPRRAGVP
jgi:hypothetical protein